MSMKGLLRHLTNFMHNNLEQNGEVINNSKLILSENNHQLWMCQDPQVLESIYHDPVQLVNMINNNKLNFATHEESLLMSKKGTTTLELIDYDELVQNIPKPYIFVTCKQFRDKPLFYQNTNDFQFLNKNKGAQ